MHFKLSRGFTIVELLIVIVVIGILGSVTLFSYGSAQLRAKVAKKEADVHTFLTTVKGAYAGGDVNSNIFIGPFLPKASAYAHLDALKVGDMRSNIVIDTFPAVTGSECFQSPPMTKDKYCVYFYNGDGYVVWWNDLTSKWVYTNETETDEQTFNDTGNNYPPDF